jgi:hypothetical protein
MGAKIIASKTWAPGDIDKICKIWDTSTADVESRQRNSVMALKVAAGMLQHLLANTCRVIFRQFIQFAHRETTIGGQLFLWRYMDDVKNGRNQRWRVFSVPRTAGTGDSYAERTGDSSTQTSKTQLVNASPAFPDDVQLDTLDYARGDMADAMVNDGIDCVANYSIIDLVVQDKAIPALDVSHHTYAPEITTAPHHPVLANMLEDLRAAFHELRSKNLPIVFCWSAKGGSGGWNKPASSDTTALVATTTTLTNLFDSTSTLKTVNTRGFTPHVYFAGRGDRTKDDGKKVAVKLCIYAEAPNSTGTFSAIGPDHVAGNTVNITVTGGAATAWYDSGTNLYLNSTADITDVSSARNKVDVLGQVATGGDKLYVWNVCGIAVWAL